MTISRYGMGPFGPIIVFRTFIELLANVLTTLYRPIGANGTNKMNLPLPHTGRFLNSAHVAGSQETTHAQTQVFVLPVFIMSLVEPTVVTTDLFATTVAFMMIVTDRRTRAIGTIGTIVTM